MTETGGEVETMTGKFHFDNGATYEGEWKYIEDDDDVTETSEKTTSIDNRRRVRHGKGTYVEGDYSYEGEWHEDQMCGNGIFRFASGNVYRGEFKANVYHGQGSFTWTDGPVYTGAWFDGKMHGVGSYVDRRGRQWDGQFYNGYGPGLKCHL